MRLSLVVVPALLMGVLISTPARAQSECVSDDDCEEGYACELDVDDAPECPPNADCEPVASEPSGWCAPARLECDSDSDCPSPATCEVEDRECVYVVEPCEVDADCDENYACLAGGSSGSCSSGSDSASSDPDAEGSSSVDTSSGEADTGSEDIKSDGVSAQEPTPDEASSDLDPGAPGPVQEPERVDGADETCEVETVNYCFPKVFPCDTDADCMDDWTCEEVPEGGPDEWADVERACLPPVIVAVIEERIDVDADGIGRSESSQDTSAGGIDDVEEAKEDDVSSDENATIPLGTQGGSEGSASCAAAANDPSELASWALAFLGFALVSLRRRRW